MLGLTAADARMLDERQLRQAVTLPLLYRYITVTLPLHYRYITVPWQLRQAFLHLALALTLVLP